ncbi:MAG: GatB/YqeY domain-containing protein [Minisyncoccia bacterium]
MIILRQKIKDETKDAMIKKDAVRLMTLRNLADVVTKEFVVKGIKKDEEVTEDDVLTIIRRLVKQRKDSIEQFTKGGRPELAENETAEMKILEAYLPQMMSKDEIKKIAEAKKIELGITDKTKLGQFVGTLMKELKGKADGADVKAVAEELFN